MQYRKPVSKRVSKKVFKATANKVHVKNIVRPSRGGVRM